MDETQEKTAESAEGKSGESAKTFWELSRKILLASVGRRRWLRRKSPLSWAG